MVRFPTAPDFTQKPFRFQEPLESRRDGISVEKRNRTNLSPVGAVSVEIYGEKINEKIPKLTPMVRFITAPSFTRKP